MNIRLYALSKGMLCALFLIGLSVAHADVLDGIGVIGDSASDEHQFESYSYSRGWVEQLVTYRGLNFGTLSTTSRGEPRRQGYEYNWARSGDQTAQMISKGQHTGLAGQVAAGDVSLAIIWIGSNDLAPYNSLFPQIYSGALNGVALQNTLNQIYGRIETAYQTVDAAGDVKFVGLTMGDFSLYPGIEALYPDAAGLARISSAVSYINGKLLDYADANAIPLIVTDSYLADVLNVGSTLNVGGVNINMNPAAGSSNPHSGFVADRLHANTVTAGIIANPIIEAINVAYGDSLDAPLLPFTDYELLSHAGLAGEYTGETLSTSVDLAAAIHYVPEVSPLAFMSIGGATILLIHFWRRNRTYAAEVSRLIHLRVR